MTYKKNPDSFSKFSTFLSKPNGEIMDLLDIQHVQATDMI